MSQLTVAASTFPFLYSHTGLDALKHLRGLGYDKFELLIFPPHCWPRDLSAQQRSEYVAWLDGEGAQVTSFCYPLLDNNPNGVDPLMREYTLDRYREAIDMAAEFKCPYVIAIPGPVNSLINPPHEWMLEWFVEGMKQLVQHAKGTGVQLLLENVPFAFLPTVVELKETAAMIGPEIGINLDICNSAYIKEDVPAMVHLLGDMIKNVHMSDTGFGEFKHDRLGTGIVEPAPAGKALEEIAYEGTTVLEIITDVLDPDADPNADIIASHDILAQSSWKARS
ncbi:MAG: L-ribulose-5-phosphate 3-epimerase [Glaciecola sp.]|jgi:L-ribulose-5-phosphate 3-epimerase|uniref:sugar phosphate isomerase/epimerase family protein n=1 Tax=Congregibacter sp. TaxID=2744308 RepID=UPI0039E5E6D3